MAERTPSKPASTCRSWRKSAASSFKCRLDRLKQEFNKKMETLFAEFASKEVVGGDTVPTSPPRTPTPATYAPFSEPATWCARTPVGQHEHEASGSNHTSNHTSEYFDAKDGLQLEYLQQLPEIPNYMERLRNRKQYGSEHLQQGYEQGIEHSQHGFENCQFGSELPQLGFEHLQQGFEHPHRGLEEQLAGSFGNMLLNTPTASHASHPHPWDDQPFLNPVASVSAHHHHDSPVPEYYYSGELNPIWFQLDDATGSHETSTAQQQQTTPPPGYGGMLVATGGMSVRTGETGDSRESLMDTAGTSTKSPYILPPVAEEKPSILRTPFNKIYAEIRRIARGDEVAFESARMGRGMRVLGRVFCYALRLRKTVMRARLAKAQRKRIREPRQPKFRQQCTKRTRTGVPTQPIAPGVSTQSTTKSSYKGVTHRHGSWNAEIRVSTCNVKVWIGTFSSEKEAALALDAGYYHCTEKLKTFNFPQFVDQLGESHYQTVLALCNAGRKKEARDLVKGWAAAHAATFGAP